MSVVIRSLPPGNAARAFHVIERSERNPIVQRHEQHDETLKRNQCALGDGMHHGRLYGTYRSRASVRLHLRAELR